MKKLVLKLCGIFILVFAMTFISLHLFSNNKQVKATETTTTPSVEILKNNVSYSDSIYILYAVACEGFETNECEVSLLFWESSQESYLKGTEVYVSSARGKVTIDGKKCLTFYSKGLAAKNMTDDLIAIAYVVVDGVEYYSEPMKFSVLEYVYKMKDSGTLNPHQQRLLERMLSYGGAAQDNFGYNTDRKADSEYFRINLHGGHHHDGFDHGLYQKGDKIKIKAHKPEDGYKFSHWIDKDGNIIGDKEEIEIEVDKDQDFEAIYKPIETIILKDNLEIDEPFDATASTLSLPDYITVNNAENVEETIEVSWDISTFIPGQIGEQIIYGSLVNSDYVLENPLSIKVNIFPYTFTLDEETQTYAINKYYGTSEEEIVPATFKELPVNTIKTKAFNEVTTLTNLVIPTTITTIEKGAIYLCDNLENITIPFIGTTENSNLFIGSIFGASSYNDQAAFIPTNLKHIVLLDGITVIPSYAFYHCSGIQSVKLPSTLTKIGYRSFNECQLLSEITIPSEVSNIDYYVFENCISLQNVYFEGTLEKWCNISFGSAGSNPMNYANNFHLKDSEGEYQVVTEIEIPNTILEIGKYQFVGFKNLSKVTFPSTLVAIKEGAFKNCSSLSSVTLPESLGLVGNGAFEQCTMLSKVEILSTRLTEIGNSAFAGCIFEEFDIPSTLQYLGDNAFNGCINLKEVTLPVGITEIKNNTFQNCMNLVSVKADGIIVSIGSSAFYSCVNLKSVEVKEGLISIGYLAFCRCINLSEFNFPTTLSSIGHMAFVDCSSLTSVTLTNNITRIEDDTFRGCINLETVILPETLEYLGSQAFNSCSKLTNIDIPSGIQVIKGYTFSGCESLGNVIIPAGVTTIEICAFYNCIAFTSIIIPEGVTSIGERALSGCVNLEIIYNLSDLELTKGSTEYGEVALYAKYIHNELPREIALEEEVSYHSTVDTLELPESVTFTYSEEEVTLDVIWDTSTFVSRQIGKQVIYGVLSDDELYDQYNIKRGCIYITLDILPYVFSLNETSNEYTLTAYYGTEEEVVIPETINNIKVASLKGTFNENETVVCVKVPKTIKNISDEAFYYCNNLLYISVDENNAVYDSRNNCNAIINSSTNELIVGTNLTVIPNDIISLGKYSFAGRNGLKEIQLPEGLKTIGTAAFRKCTSLESITIPSTVTNIRGYAFDYCTCEIVWDNPTITTLKDSSFYNYLGTNIVIPSTVTKIESYAFMFCSNLTSVIIGENVTSIGTYAFKNCDNLKTVYNLSSLEFTIGSEEYGYVAYYADNVYTKLS